MQKQDENNVWIFFIEKENSEIYYILKSEIWGMKHALYITLGRRADILVEVLLLK